MTANIPAFRDRSRRVAKKFLQSVVVLDDRAELPQPPGSETPYVGGGVDKRGLEPSIRRRVPKLVPPADTQRRPEDLDAKTLIDAFADCGLVCAVLKPDDNEDPKSKTVAVAGRADIVILDWNIHGDGGDVTCQIIQGILKSDDANRLRLIAIYTGEPGLRNIMSRVRTTLASVGDGAVKRDGEFAVTRGPVRISVFAKEDTRIHRGSAAHSRIVDEAALPDELISEFARLGSGLVSNVMLESIAVVRANTHRMLARLGSSLDPGYLWHRALQLQPEDAQEHLVQLVSSEIRSLLDDARVGDQAGIDAIEQWLADSGTADFGPKFGESDPRSVDEVKELLRFGTASGTPESRKAGSRFSTMNPKNAHKRAVDLPLFASTAAAASASNEQFATAMSVKTHYDHPIPQLRLGTIVSCRKGAGRQFWLCMQPKCDSVRMTAGRAFPLLPLTAVDAGKTFHIALPRRSLGCVRLALGGKPFGLAMPVFEPANGSGPVVAERRQGRYCFKSVKAVYRWEGDLKDEYAQRIANNFAYEFSRVGLSESEWLRLWSK